MLLSSLTDCMCHLPIRCVTSTSSSSSTASSTTTSAHALPCPDETVRILPGVAAHPLLLHLDDVPGVDRTRAQEGENGKVDCVTAERVGEGGTNL